MNNSVISIKSCEYFLMKNENNGKNGKISDNKISKFFISHFNHIKRHKKSE